MLILGAEIPEDDAAGQIETGQLFLKAGDAQHALKHSLRALAMIGRTRPPLQGAGNAAFQLGDYARASRYLEAALAQDPSSESDQATPRMSPRWFCPTTPWRRILATEERNRRVIVDFDQALRRLQSCLGQQSGKSNSATSSLQSLEADALAMQSKLQPRNLRRDPELLGAGMELISKIEEATNAGCGEPTGLDHALLLIGRKHQGALQ